MSGALTYLLSQGDALLAQERPEAAEPIFRQMLAFEPNSPDAAHRLSIVAVRTGRPEAALALAEQALALRPRAWHHHDARARALLALGRRDAAIDAWLTAIRIEPKAAVAHFALADALAEADRLDVAAKHYRRVFALDPRAAPALNGLGRMLQRLDRLDEAEAAFRQALRIDPSLPELHFNLAYLMLRDDRLAEAEAVLRAGFAGREHHTSFRYGLSELALYGGRSDDSIELLHALLADHPELQDARLALANRYLATGRLEAGWHHDGLCPDAGGRQKPRLPGANWAGPNLTGEEMNGRTLLLLSDQGFGDFLQYCRLAVHAARHARVVLEVPKTMLRLALKLPGIAQVLPMDPNAPLPACDRHCILTRLWAALRLPLDQVSDGKPYLFAEPAEIEAWRARLAALPEVAAGARTVGLVWAGNPSHFDDRIRSIPFEAFSAFADLPGHCFVSLQKTARPGRGLTVHDWTDELRDFADTAALVMALDLVVTVDSAVAHLAGALGRPVWMLNRRDCETDPRWLERRADSPWYPSMRIFRQTGYRDWAGVLTQVRAALLENAP